MITFVNGCNWTQVSDPQWSDVGGWDTDRATILWRGRRDKKEAFENTIQRFAGMPNYPLMRLAKWSNGEGTKNLPGVELVYTGFRNGAIPPAKSVDSFTLQSVQSSGRDTSVGNPTSGKIVSGTIYYRASRSSWTWYETSTPPITPRYATVNQPLDPLSSEAIQRYVLNASDTDTEPGQPVGFVTFSVLAAITRGLAKRLEISDYQREPIIQGALWGCSANVDYKLYGGGG